MLQCDKCQICMCEASTSVFSDHNIQANGWTSNQYTEEGNAFLQVLRDCPYRECHRLGVRTLYRVRGHRL